jgi:hypothetical protein
VESLLEGFDLALKQVQEMRRRLIELAKTEPIIEAFRPILDVDWMRAILVPLIGFFSGHQHRRSCRGADRFNGSAVAWRGSRDHPRPRENKRKPAQMSQRAFIA